eukprot:3908182-Rhodomonas_salina.10
MSAIEAATGSLERVSSYAGAMRCPVLTSRMLFTGDLRSDGTVPAIGLGARYALPGADMGYAPTRSRWRHTTVR